MGAPAVAHSYVPPPTGEEELQPEEWTPPEVPKLTAGLAAVFDQPALR